MNKILLDQLPADSNGEPKDNHASNIFNAKKESLVSKSSFPDWDIVPPDQFINPRIRSQQ